LPLEELAAQLFELLATLPRGLSLERAGLHQQLNHHFISAFALLLKLSQISVAQTEQLLA